MRVPCPGVGPAIDMSLGFLGSHSHGVVFPKDRATDLSLCLPNPPLPPHQLLVVMPGCPRLVGSKPPGSLLPATAPAGRPLISGGDPYGAGRWRVWEKREENGGVMDRVAGRCSKGM